MSLAGIRRVTVVVASGKTKLYTQSMHTYFPHMEIDYTEVDPMDKTGVALRAGMEQITDAQYMLVTNGDTYIPDLDLDQLITYHNENHADWTFVLKYIRTNVEKFGNVTIQGNRVQEFIEKPSSPDMFKYLTNCGWYFVNRDFLDALSYGGNHLEIDLFPDLPSKGNIFAYIYSKPWYHIQSMSEYDRINSSVN